jgi:hypothetical protein
MRELSGVRHGRKTMKPIQLDVNGVKLHVRFSALVLDALARMEAAPTLPPLPKGHIYFQASDDSLHSIPQKCLAQARRIDPGLKVLWPQTVANSEGSGGFTVTTGRPRSYPKFTRAERDVLRTLYFVVFAS